MKRRSGPASRRRCRCSGGRRAWHCRRRSRPARSRARAASATACTRIWATTSSTWPCPDAISSVWPPRSTRSRRRTRGSPTITADGARPSRRARRPMRRRTRIAVITLAVLAVGVAGVVGCFRGYLAGVLPSATADLSDIRLPPGFQISVFAPDVPNARQMALGPNGIVFVGSRSAGKVYAVAGDKVHVLASGLEMPSGIAYRDGALYIGAVSRILRLRDVAANLTRPPKPEVVSSAFPTEGHHGWKFLAFGPDGKLYVPVGAPCNVCEPPGPLHATITRIDVVGGPPEVVARGVRNTVGFDFHPRTQELWFTDNGRDWLGDDQPPDELNRLGKAGEHFGFPFCHGTGMKDPEHNR